MALCDYILCCKCGCKLIYDGDRGQREWWEERFDKPPEIECPDCKQPQQEPVAWQWLDTAHFRKHLPKNAEPGAWNPLYTRPPRREWVGLTLDEWREIDNRHDWRTTQGRIDATEEVAAKLKEKNA